MKFAIFSTATGEILRTLNCPLDQVAVNCGAGESFIEADVDDSVHYIDLDTIAPMVFPARPADHDWDWSARAWQPNLNALKARKLREIEQERDRRVVDPILVYDGKRLDADAVSIDRLNKKLATTDIHLKRGTTPPAAALVWRDADNLTHSWPDLASYRSWLEGFALALDDRGMAAFAWSWAKKAELAALVDFEQVQALPLD